MPKMISALIVGWPLAERGGAAPASDKIFAEEHDHGATDGIVGFIADFAGNGRGRAQTESQIFRFQARTNDDRDRRVDERLAGDGVDDSATDSKGGRGGGSLRLSWP